MVFGARRSCCSAARARCSTTRRDARATSLLSRGDWTGATSSGSSPRQRVVPLVTWMPLKDGARFESAPRPATAAVLAQQHDHIARRNLFLTGRLVGLLRTPRHRGRPRDRVQGTGDRRRSPMEASACGSSGTSTCWCSRATTGARAICCCHAAATGCARTGDQGVLADRRDGHRLMSTCTGTSLRTSGRAGLSFSTACGSGVQQAASAGGIPTLSAEDMLVVLTIQLRKDAREGKELQAEQGLRHRGAASSAADAGLERRVRGGQAARVPACAVARTDGGPGAARRAGRRHASAGRARTARRLEAAVRLRPVGGCLRTTDLGGRRRPMSHRRCSVPESASAGGIGFYSWYSRPVGAPASCRHLRPSVDGPARWSHLPARLSFLYYLVRPISAYGRDYARSSVQGPVAARGGGAIDVVAPWILHRFGRCQPAAEGGLRPRRRTPACGTGPA